MKEVLKTLIITENPGKTSFLSQGTTGGKGIICRFHFGTEKLTTGPVKF